MGGLFDRVTKLLGRDDTTVASVTTRGTKGAVATEIVDSSGNSISSAIVGGFDTLNSLVTEPYNYIKATYNDDSRLSSVVFRMGGSSGTIVSTFTITYTASGKFLDLTKS